MRSFKRRYRRGALLIEAAVAAGLLIVVFVLFLESSTSNLKNSDRYQRLTQAESLLQGALVKAQADLENRIDSGTLINERSETLSGIEFSIREQIEDTPGTGEYKLAATVSWNLRGQAKSVSDELIIQTEDSLP